MTGLELCRRYFEEYGRPAIKKQFQGFLSKIAVGVVGEGSDRMGFDDEISTDHDWGPGFCIWVTDETYEEIGEQLKECYENLPKEYLGYHRAETVQGEFRYGVMTINEFYERLIGTSDYDEIDWRNLDDASLLAAIDGEIYEDEEGIFSGLRNRLKEGYPEDIRYFKLSEDVAKISQTGQYNYRRMLERGDRMTADRMLCDCIGHVMRLAHHLDNHYSPHDKWLYRSCERLPHGKEICGRMQKLHACLRMDDSTALWSVNEQMEELCSYLAMELYARDEISDVDSCLAAHTMELFQKGTLCGYSREELVEKIVRLEFEAFDQVQNEGGRASCQDNWQTFSIMRRSQYSTYNAKMLRQYLYDFTRELHMGHNLIAEKYGRMMESTDPERYRELSVFYPVISEQKKAIIEQIVAIQTEMMEEFARAYPRAAGNARILHTSEDTIGNTSYETYLRGEISTYSDKMLELYGRYVVRCVQSGENIAKMTILNTAKEYGYSSLEVFEQTIGAWKSDGFKTNE